MSILEIVMGVVLIILAGSLRLVFLFQEGDQRSRKESIDLDLFLVKNVSAEDAPVTVPTERWTRIIAIGFFLAVVATNAVIYFGLFSK